MIKIFLYIVFFIFSNEASTDCTKTAGTNGNECKAKTTFLSNSQWNFKVEEDMGYMCCYFTGKIRNKDYEGCFAFYEEDIKNYKVNDLLDKIEKGKWELSSGIPQSNPSIDCFSKLIKINFQIFFLNILIFFL